MLTVNTELYIHNVDNIINNDKCSDSQSVCPWSRLLEELSFVVSVTSFLNKHANAKQ